MASSCKSKGKKTPTCTKIMPLLRYLIPIAQMMNSCNVYLLSCGSKLWSVNEKNYVLRSRQHQGF